jgi:hypothetical protein
MTVLFVYFVWIGECGVWVFHVRNDSFYDRGAEFVAGRVLGKIFLVWILV